MSRDPNAVMSGPSAGVIGRCFSCGADHWCARAHCPRCMSTDVRLVDIEPRGIVHSFTVERRPTGDWAAMAHLILAYVAVGDGLLILAHLVECEPDEVRIGMSVVGAPAASPSGTQVARFRPDRASERAIDA